jgi:acetyltransferase EpsM
MPAQVIIPLLNPNEPEALLAALHVTEGQLVALGEPLCTLETTKSTAELNAETGGFVVGLRFSQGQTVRAGDHICYLAESPDWQPPAEDTIRETGGEENLPGGLRITTPALALARQLGVELDRLPTGPLVTESTVQALAGKAAREGFEVPPAVFDATAIIIYGGGGHGKSLIELVRSLGSYRIVGIVDDSIPISQTILGLPVLGGGEVLADLHARGVRLAANAVGGIGDLAVRVKIFDRLSEAGFTCPAFVHPSAYVENSAQLSPGVQVFPNAYVGSDVHLGFGTIINTGAIVSHDCRLGNYVNISPGAILAGGARVGDGVLIGMGATINLQAQIGREARIGNNATVKSDVPEAGVVRAGSTYPE